jgi:hypothetical protein
MRYLVVCNFGCLIQSLDCLQLSTGIQCLECASMIHLLFISRKIEADSGTHGSGPQKWDAEPILASLSASFNFAVTWHPKNNLILLLLERFCSDNQHWCRSLDKLYMRIEPTTEPCYRNICKSLCQNRRELHIPLLGRQ